MKYFNFDNLIDKYSNDFTFIRSTNGSYNDLGDWVSSYITEAKKGAIIGINERKIYSSNGLLTEKDKELFMKESLGDIDKAHVIYEGNKYSVEASPQNNSQFTGVWQYTLKWVSVFKGGDTVV